MSADWLMADPLRSGAGAVAPASQRIRFLVDEVETKTRLSLTFLKAVAEDGEAGVLHDDV